MKMIVRWINESNSCSTGIDRNSKLVKDIYDGKIFGKVYNFKNGNKFISYNFANALMVELEEEINDDPTA